MNGSATLCSGGNVRCPLVVLQTVHALEAQHVRPGAVESRRFVRAVIVHEEMVRRGGRRRAKVEVDSALVVALHVVHLDPLDPPLLILLHHGHQLLVQQAPRCPH